MSNETKGALLYLRALTSLHPGSGSALGSVDLPVQRERHTDWPLIPGTSLKGVLRDACRRGDGSDPKLENRLFGRADSEGREDATLYAGALSFTDARILAFPVRSLKGVFAWVTCRQALERWKRDAALAGVTVQLPAIQVPADGALVPKGSPCLHNGEVILEEYRFKAQEWAGVECPALAADDGKRLMVVDDTDFTHFVKYSTEVTARIGLDHATKTVKEGALFYQEFLPAETVLYSVVLAAPSRLKEDPASAAQNLSAFQPPAVIQVGGDETTGKGLCQVVWKGGK